MLCGRVRRPGRHGRRRCPGQCRWPRVPGSGAGLRCAGRADDGLRRADQLVVDVPQGAEQPARDGQTCPGRGRRVAGMAVTSFAVRDGRAVRRGGRLGAGDVGGCWLRAAAPAVVLADVQFEQRLAGVAEPAQRAGGGQRAAHVISHDLIQAGRGGVLVPLLWRSDGGRGQRLPGAAGGDQLPGGRAGRRPGSGAGHGEGHGGACPGWLAAVSQPSCARARPAATDRPVPQNVSLSG